MSALYQGSVTHTRVSPVRHRLQYRLFSLLLDLETLDGDFRSLRLISHNRFNLFSFHDADYGDGTTTPLAWARAQMRQAGLEDAGSRIKLLTMPRLLGYAFNPLSVYFCFSADGALAAILYEVNNTFGQRHSYFLQASPSPDGMIRQNCLKNFYVSPFMDMALRYEFFVQPPEETLRVRIAAYSAAGLVLTAALALRRTLLTDANLLRAAAKFPLLTLKVVAGIHWEAVKLWRKGLRPRVRPAAPLAPVSFAPDSGRVL